MDKAQLETLLHKLTPSEEWHLAHLGEPSPVYARTPLVDMDGQSVFLFDWKNTLEENAVGIIKETRYTTVPPHVNQDMELNYIYEGKCDFAVAGHSISLQRGDTIIFDTNVVRSSPTPKAEDDIVISMVFRKEFFDAVFLSQLPGGGILTSFLFEFISRRRRHDRFLIVPAKYSGNLRALMQLILEEGLYPDFYSKALIRSYAHSVFLELVRGLAYGSEGKTGIPGTNEKVVRILEYIERNYKECTLVSTAAEFGYSTNYLGNLLKASTGKTFTQIRTSQQMSEAAYLLLNTDRAITGVAHKVGITNMSYFYRKFENTYKMTPREYRQATSGGIE